MSSEMAPTDRKMRNYCRGALKVAGLSVTALAVGIGGVSLSATPAQAIPHNCAVVAEKPVFANEFSPAGKKMINFPIKVSCPAPWPLPLDELTVETRQDRYESDSTSGDDHEEPRDVSHHSVNLKPGEEETIRSVHVLVNTEDGDEEVYHKVRYRVLYKNHEISGWTEVAQSPETKFSK